MNRLRKDLYILNLDISRIVLTSISVIVVDNKRKKYSSKSSSLRASARLCLRKTLKFVRDQKQLTLVNRRKEGRGYG